MDSEPKYFSYCRALISGLCNYPEDLKLEMTKDDRGIHVIATVHKEDMGSVIGREGKTIETVRTLLKIAGAREDARVSLSLTEPDGSLRERKPVI